ncbi:MAG: deoxyribose-phosphate aldolase [Desulfurococcaceae archaeon TW002]
MLDFSKEKILEILKTLNTRIDQTMLKYDKGLKDYMDFAEKSDKFSFRSIVVPSIMVKEIAPIVKTPVAGVVGFPYGYHPTETKIKEIEYIGRNGGKEVDVVINLIHVKSGNYSEVSNEIEKLVRSAREIGLGIKIIVETSVLSDDELVRICKILLTNKPDFVKTNTGFGPRGVSVRDVLIIKKIVGDELKIKASGGVRNTIEALNLIMFGADVIGTSAGIEIIKDRDVILGSVFLF